MFSGFRFRAKSVLIAGLAVPLCLLGAGIAVAFRSETTPPIEPEAASPVIESPIAALPPEAPAEPASLQTNALALEAAVEYQNQFVWPALGAMTSYVGPGHPTGVDIALRHEEDSLIRAAAAGTVIFAGGTTCCGYGLHVEIEHDDGWSTLYGHFSIVGAKVGQRVEQGGLLGLGGNTGYSEGKHLHFELMKDQEYVDPLRFLTPDQVRKRDATAVSCPNAPIIVDPASRVAVSFPSPLLSESRLLSASVRPLTPGRGEPAIEAEILGSLNLVIIAEASANATGRAHDYDLALKFADASGATTDSHCILRLRTMQTFPTLTRYTRPIPTPTRKPAATATKPPVPTATKPPAARPTAVGTATPMAGRPQSAPATAPAKSPTAARR